MYIITYIVSQFSEIRGLYTNTSGYPVLRHGTQYIARQTILLIEQPTSLYEETDRYDESRSKTNPLDT